MTPVDVAAWLIVGFIGVVILAAIVVVILAVISTVRREWKK